MTPDALDEALASQPAEVITTQGRPLYAPATGNAASPFDYAKFVRGIEVITGASSLPLPTRRMPAPPCVPTRYAVGPVALRERISPQLMRAVDGMLPGMRYGALFLGPSGCGKSSAAAFAVQRWRAKSSGGSVCWLDAIEATDAERRYKLGSGDPHWLVDAGRADWLVLDDVGKSSGVALVQLVLARRYQAQLPTIVTTGLERGELTEYLGAATVRRIVEYEGRARAVLVDCHVGRR